MPHQILSTKLSELDTHIARLQSRIPMSESTDHLKIKAETESLRKEYSENERALLTKLLYSKSNIVSILASAFNQIEPIIKNAVQDIKTYSDDHDEEISMENKLLLAEYELDFSILAIDRALIASLDAAYAQITASKEKQQL